MNWSREGRTVVDIAGQAGSNANELRRPFG